jgi:glyoxylase-like metal-dependent hydrolase (beta-lactamase superfamily II)
MKIRLCSRVLALACLATTIATPPSRAGEEPVHFTLQRLGEGVYGAIAKKGGAAGSNAGLVIGEDGVAVIDTFQKAEAATELLSEIRKLTPLPVWFAVNTHYHLDHVAGNGVFHDAGATIAAQRNVRAWERTENLKWWGDDVPDAARKLVESLTLPELTYDDGIDLWLRKRHLEVRSLPGHTGSDSIVVVADASVVFTGDLFWNRTLPNTIDATTEAWIATVDRLVADYPNATFVPGHGEPGRADDVKAFGTYLRTLKTLVANAIAAHESGPKLVDSVLPKIRETYGDWAFFDHFAKDNVAQAEAEQRGSKRRP